MAHTKRPTRVVLTLIVFILLGVGSAAYLVNIPIAWIIAVEAFAMLGLAWRVSQSKPARAAVQSAQESPPQN